MKKTLLIAPILIVLSGCANLPATVKELAGDPATVAAQLTTVYGTAKFVRVGSLSSTNGSVTVSPDGTVTIKAGQ